MTDGERAAWDAGRARERAEVVAWLREMRRVHHERDLKDLAMLVEQGRHLRTE